MRVILLFVVVFIGIGRGALRAQEPPTATDRGDRSANASADASVQLAEDARYAFHEGRHWYQHADNAWSVWNGAQWIDFKEGMFKRPYFGQGTKIRGYRAIPATHRDRHPAPVSPPTPRGETSTDVTNSLPSPASTEQDALTILAVTDTPAVNVPTNATSNSPPDEIATTKGNPVDNPFAGDEKVELQNPFHETPDAPTTNPFALAESAR